MSTKSDPESVTLTFATVPESERVPVYFNAFSIAHSTVEGVFLSLWHIPLGAATRDAVAVTHIRINNDDLKRSYEESFERYMGSIGTPSAESASARLPSKVSTEPYLCANIPHAARVGDNAEIGFSAFSIREVQTAIKSVKPATIQPRLWSLGRFVSTFDVHRRLVFALFESIPTKAIEAPSPPAKSPKK